MILVFGTICIDRLRRVPRLPELGGYVEMLTDESMLGGEAANTAYALHAWGADYLLAGNDLGDGFEGELLEHMLIEKGLSTKHLVRGSGEPPVCDIYITPDAERTMFGRGFSTMKPAIPLSELPFQAGGWFTAEPNMAVAARQAARLAADAGMNLYVMDFISADEDLPPGSFWQTSTDWAGHRGDVESNLAWLEQWVRTNRCFGMLSDGPNGFVAGSAEEGVRFYPPYPLPAIVDTTGAGDMFRAGVLYGLDQDWPVAKCLQFGAAAGSLKCQGFGATGYAPSIEEIEQHIADYPEVSAQY